jgi:hypothetical protein
MTLRMTLVQAGGGEMMHNQSTLAKCLCVLGLGITLLVAHSYECGAVQPEKSRNIPPVGPRTIGTCTVVIGEIRGAPTADHSKLKCSEVLNLTERVIVKRFQIYRNAYVVDMANKTVADGEDLMYLPRVAASWSEHGDYFGGEKESVLDTWECKLPTTKGLAIVVSSAVLELSDGRRIICRFRPLMFANGRVLTRGDSEDEKDTIIH